MLIPILTLSLGTVGLLVCGFLVLGMRTRDTRPTPSDDVIPSQLNKAINLARYKTTDNSIVHLDRGLPDHPFKLGDGGVFCSVCLINTNMKRQTEPVRMHSHVCTVIRKDWKILVCRAGGQAEYFISLDRAHFKRAS